MLILWTDGVGGTVPNGSNNILQCQYRVAASKPLCIYDLTWKQYIKRLFRRTLNCPLVSKMLYQQFYLLYFVKVNEKELRKGNFFLIPGKKKPNKLF